MQKFILISRIILISVIFLLSAGTAQAAILTAITATPASVASGATTSYTFTFTTTNTIANNGKVAITFPAGFDVSGASFTSWTGFDGDKTLSAVGQTITITRTSGASSTAGVKTIVLGNIINNSTVGNSYQVSITTKTSANATLDGPTNTIYFQIFASNIETDISGIYYLRGSNITTHYQNNGDTTGTGNDLGILSRVAPTSDEYRNCTAWTHYYFDENGTYTQTNQINNIYYHIWWAAGSSATIGYNINGGYSNITEENFSATVNNSPNKVGSYYLYAGEQLLSSPRSIAGNAIYNFGVTLSATTPYTLSSLNRPSFIIINLPDDATLHGLDTDSDGLTDYDELFTYYTDPYKADTDGDGWNDKYEVDNNLNPNDADSAPSYGKWLLKQYSGSAGSYFGYAVDSISDIDGDGKDDVLVGAFLNNSGAGAAYIYSSGNGNLIRQYNGSAGSSFGSSVSSISDIDGDGKEDVLVGASYLNSGAGAAYIYSTGTGNLIKQYSGSAGSYFGSSISSISDIDGDGKEDVLVGANSLNSGAGAAYIYSSGTGNLIKQYSGSAGSYFGSSISSISDIDGDGKDDVLVGAFLFDSGAGAAYIYSSNTGNLIKQYSGSAGSAFGNSVSSISDIDGDGKDDVLIGASATNAATGAAYIYSSGTGNLIKQYSGSAGSSFGNSVSSISDVDGDGKDDVLFGAYNLNGGAGATTGAAYIYSSNTGNLIKQYSGSAGSYFGSSISSISDIDGDGKDDILVGAYFANSGAGAAYIYSSIGNIVNQSWTKDTSNTSAIDLDDYFIDSNNSTLPARNQTVTYTASTANNPNIDVSIGAGNVVSFSQPAGWIGTEHVVFTATDSTGLSSTSNTVTLAVTGTTSTDATITSSIYSVSTVSTTLGGSGTITDVPAGTSKTSFESNLIKNQAYQTWDDSEISSILTTGDKLVVTAQDGSTQATYTISLSPSGGAMPATAAIKPLVKDNAMLIIEIKQQLIVLITQVLQLLQAKLALMMAGR